MLAVRCRGLCKVWPSGVVALDGVDLEVGEGEPVVLMGPSGAGKTTLIRLVSGLERLDAGRFSSGVKQLPREVCICLRASAGSEWSFRIWRCGRT